MTRPITTDGRYGHDTREGKHVTARKWFGRTSIVIGVLIAAIAVVASASAGKKASNPYGLMKPGTLTVGMTLQFKPQMYLDANGKPAGYDVVILKALAKKWGVKLDIKNLDFNGLIPGLVSKKFDMVSVGLSATPERRKSISFSRAYVPYAQILAAASPAGPPPITRTSYCDELMLRRMRGREEPRPRTSPDSYLQAGIAGSGAPIVDW